MRLLRIWIHHFHYAFSGMLQNRMVNAISIGTITISILFLGTFALLYVNTTRWVIEWGKSVFMSVYLEDGIDQAARKGVEAAIRSVPGAQIEAYISKEKAIADLKATLGSQAGLLDGLTANPLPASYEVVFQDVEKGRFDPKSVKGGLEKTRGVSEVQYSEQYQDRFGRVIHALKIAGLIAALLLCMAVLIIVTNTIKLTIYARREEISILKLVGASDWFVRTPLLIEGAAQGFIGGVIALLLLFLLHRVLSIEEIHVLGIPLMRVVFLPSHDVLLLIFLGLALGLSGGFIAIGRFFKF
jgi:cell division transport system permease protein